MLCEKTVNRRSLRPGLFRRESVRNGAGDFHVLSSDNSRDKLRLPRRVDGGRLQQRMAAFSHGGNHFALFINGDLHDPGSESVSGEFEWECRTIAVGVGEMCTIENLSVRQDGPVLIKTELVHTFCGRSSGRPTGCGANPVLSVIT